MTLEAIAVTSKSQILLLSLLGSHTWKFQANCTPDSQNLKISLGLEHFIVLKLNESTLCRQAYFLKRGKWKDGAGSH